MATLKDSKYFSILPSQYVKRRAHKHVTDYNPTLVTPQKQNLNCLCRNLAHIERNVRLGVFQRGCHVWFVRHKLQNMALVSLINPLQRFKRKLIITSLQ